MSTKKTTTTTRQFDPTAKSAHNAFTTSGQGVLLDYMKNPMDSSFFQQRLGMALTGANEQGNTLMRSMLSGPALLNPNLAASRTAKAARATTNLKSNAFMQNLLASEEIRRWATSGALNYQPLETGQTTTEKKSGLGTWLPQALAIGTSVALAPFTGGASLAGIPGAVGGFGGGNSQSAATQFAPTSNASFYDDGGFHMWDFGKGAGG